MTYLVFTSVFCCLLSVMVIIIFLKRFMATTTLIKPKNLADVASHRSNNDGKLPLRQMHKMIIRIVLSMTILAIGNCVLAQAVRLSSTVKWITYPLLSLFEIAFYAAGLTVMLRSL